MKPQIGSVYLDGERETYFKILAHGTIEGLNQVAVAEIKKAKLVEMPYMTDEMQFSSMKLLDHDPFKICLCEEQLSDAQVRIRDARYESILPIISNENWLDPSFRTQAIKSLAAKVKISRATLYNNLKRYIVRGPEKMGMTPTLDNCGGKGKRKTFTTYVRYSKKQNGAKPVTLTDEVEQVMLEEGFKKYFIDHAQNSCKAAYKAFLSNAGYRRDDYKPSYAKFKYWGFKKYPAKDISIGRNGEINFNKDERFLLGNVRHFVFGPGSVSMIDSTRKNVKVLSVLRDRSIGRFSFYYVVDVYTGAYVGVNITSEHASYLVSCGCLVNMVEDKRAFCERYDVPYNPDDWIFDHLPGRLIADRGELISGFSNSMVNNLGITVTNVRSYGAELKSLVEYSFRRTDQELKGHLSGNGLILSRINPRITDELETDACLTLKEVYQMVIREMIYHNRNTWIEDHELAPQLTALGQACTPINIWKLGVKLGLGIRTIRKKEEVWINCLPNQKVRLDRRGIFFKTKYWVPTEKEGIKLLEDLYFSGVKKVEIAFNKNYIPQTFLFHNKQFFHIAPKVETEIEDFFNLDEHNEQTASIRREHANKALDDAIEKHKAHEETIKSAKSLKANVVDYKNVSENRHAEAESHRSQTYEETLPSSSTAIPDSKLNEDSNPNGPGFHSFLDEIKDI